jgi:hypothetical protein
VFTTDAATMEWDSDITYNPSTATLTTTTFSGALDGNAATASTASAVVATGVTEAMMASVDFGDFTCGAGATDCDLNTGVVDVTAMGTASVDGDELVDGSVDMTEVDPAINLATTGTITGNINVVLDSTTADSPTGADLRGSMLIYSNAGVVNITLPDVDTVGIGASACFYDSDATAILTIEPDGDDLFLLDDTLLDAADTINSPGDLGDFICIMAIDADTTWATLGRRGTWVDDGAL